MYLLLMNDLYIVNNLQYSISELTTPMINIFTWINLTVEMGGIEENTVSAQINRRYFLMF